jgi:hypothetical protein
MAVISLSESPLNSEVILAFRSPAEVLNESVALTG